FYRGFNRAFESVTKVYVGGRRLDGEAHGAHDRALRPHRRGDRLGFVRQPTGFLPTEDQGYAILVSILPEGASQPRSREVAEKINAILERTDGVGAWVTIGGLSILDFANVPNFSATFVVYKDWKHRGAALTQDRIVAKLNRELAPIQEALAFVVIPPPIRGLGQTGGFQMMVQDRRSLGLAELQRTASELAQRATSRPGLQGLATT